MPNFSSNWLITSTGIAAPPDTPSRRTDAIALRSWRSAAPGRFSSVMYIVGTPAKIVTLCACIALNTASGSKRGSSTIDAPAIRAAFICTVWPKLWKSGSTIRCTSSAAWRMIAWLAMMFIATLEWVSSAPFGLPVVPEV